MFALIFIGVFVVSLVVIILTLLEKNHDLQIDNENWVIKQPSYYLKIQS
jgi:hypothetical protein